MHNCDVIFSGTEGMLHSRSPIQYSLQLGLEFLEVALHAWAIHTLSFQCCEKWWPLKPLVKFWYYESPVFTFNHCCMLYIDMHKACLSMQLHPVKYWTVRKGGKELSPIKCPTYNLTLSFQFWVINFLRLLIQKGHTLNLHTKAAPPPKRSIIILYIVRSVSMVTPNGT